MTTTFFNNLNNSNTLWINLELRTPGTLPDPLPTKQFNANDSGNTSVTPGNSYSPTLGTNNGFMYFWMTSTSNPPPNGTTSIGTLVISSGGNYLASLYPTTPPGIYAETDNNSSTAGVTWSVITDLVITYKNNTGQNIVINTTSATADGNLDLQQLPLAPGTGTTVLQNGSLSINLGRVGIGQTTPPNTRSIVALYDLISTGIGQLPHQATRFINSTGGIQDSVSDGKWTVTTNGNNMYEVISGSEPAPVTTSSGGGLPAWAWVLIIIVAIILVGLIIWLIYEATKKDDRVGVAYNQIPGQVVYTQQPNNVLVPGQAYVTNQPYIANQPVAPVSQPGVVYNPPINQPVGQQVGQYVSNASPPSSWLPTNGATYIN